MNNIDKQLDKGSHSLGEVVETSSLIVPGPHSRPIASEAATVRSMDPCLEQETSLQVVSSKTTSRRAWLRRGVAVASPVVATLASAPVYGAGCLALNPSGFVSASTFASRHPGEMVCAFPGPNYWLGNLRAWPGSSPDTTKAKFVDVIGPAFGVDAAITSGTKLDAVLGGNFSLLAKYCIAAYLNARSGTSGFPLTALQAGEVYKSYRGGPVSTLLVTGWTETQTVAWLQILMT